MCVCVCMWFRNLCPCTEKRQHDESSTPPTGRNGTECDQTHKKICANRKGIRYALCAHSRIFSLGVFLFLLSFAPATSVIRSASVRYPVFCSAVRRTCSVACMRCLISMRGDYALHALYLFLVGCAALRFRVNL